MYYNVYQLADGTTRATTSTWDCPAAARRDRSAFKTGYNGHGRFSSIIAPNPIVAFIGVAKVKAPAHVGLEQP